MFTVVLNSTLYPEFSVLFALCFIKYFFSVPHDLFMLAISIPYYFHYLPSYTASIPFPKNYLFPYLVSPVSCSISGAGSSWGKMVTGIRLLKLLLFSLLKMQLF